MENYRQILVTVICVVITVVIINIVSLIGLAIYRNANEISSKSIKLKIQLEIFLRILKKQIIKYILMIKAKLY